MGFSQDIRETNFYSKVDSLVNTFQDHLDTDPQEALESMNKTYQMALNLSHYEALSKICYFIGVYYVQFQGRPGEAEPWLTEGIHYADLTEDYVRKAYLLRMLGIASYQKGEYELTLKLFERAKKAALLGGSSKLADEMIMATAVIYIDYDQLERARGILKSILLRDPAPHMKNGIFDNLGKIMSRSGKYDSAVYYYEKELPLCVHSVDPLGCKIGALNNIASNLIRRQDYKGAMKNYSILLDMIAETERNLSYTEVCINIALCAENLGEYDTALYYLNTSKEMADSLHYQDELILIFKTLKSVYSKMGEFEQALQYAELYQQLNDSIYGLENTARVEELLVRYETEKKDKEIALLAKENALTQIDLTNERSAFIAKQLQDSIKTVKNNNAIRELEGQNKLQKLMLEKGELEAKEKDGRIVLLEQQKALEAAKLEKQRRLQITYLIIAILVSLFSVVIYYIFRQKILTQKLLAEKAEEANKEKTLQIIRSHELESVKASAEGEKRERDRIAKELHDGIAASIAGIKLHLSRFENNSSNGSIGPVISKIDQVYDELRSITHNLKPTRIYNSSFQELMTDLIQDRAQLDNFVLELSFHPTNILDQLSDDLKVETYRIIQELLTNIGKYANASHVSIQFLAAERTLSIMVEDDGDGFDSKKHREGIGLTNIKERLAKVDGEIQIDSQVNRGTIIDMSIPLKVPNLTD